MATTAASTDSRAALPSVDRVLRSEAGAKLVAAHGRALALDAVREVLAELRTERAAASEAGVAADAAARLAELTAPSQKPVFNLTGVVLHTNLGRAPMPPEAAAAAAAAMQSATNLEFDLDSGKRGDRDAHVESWICRLTGAEAATVVNNNAAAVLLVLNTFALRKEVPVSRGELIEIGGAFRMPEIMARAGCRLVEVGTTNRTHLKDYAGAISKKTGMLMKVHPSNYAIAGFTKTVGDAELARLAHEHGLPYAVDLGSGQLVDLAQYGLPHEPTPAEAIAAGADLVTFSGDKLLGGPQCGIVVGKAALMAKLDRNPLKRALRLDKGRLAALEAVLKLYADPERLAERLPTLRLLIREQGEIRAAAERLRPAMTHAVGAGFAVTVAECASQIGSGSLPVDRLASACLAIRAKAKGGGSVERLAAALRALPKPVVGRIEDGALKLDLRCLEDEAGFRANLDGFSLS
ncbi:L-seryl-tRNA(Sec) selenium transferase [Desertibaculum subflavum]|uniref:L-seryl-tRNA(Sec) selenium transferase n=1 Tax=Desertibaculum subflavum TaxID=2268458 RepID=UPI000E66F2C6